MKLRPPSAVANDRTKAAVADDATQSSAAGEPTQPAVADDQARSAVADDATQPEVADDASLHATTVPGDSSVGAASDVEADGIPSTDDRGSKPRQTRHQRMTEKTKPIYNPQLRKERREMWENRNDAPGIGNVGWLFGNWGAMPSCKHMREGVELMLKNNPAQIIALAECGHEAGELLRAPGARGDPQLRLNNTDPQLRGENELKSRDAYEYLTLRGQEKSSILIGVRANNGNNLELLDWEGANTNAAVAAGAKMEARTKPTHTAAP